MADYTNATLQEIAKAMVAPNKGVLAADESNRTATKRLESINMESSEDNRRDYRELFLGMDGVENYLSGVILYDETIRQSLRSGQSFVDRLKEIGVIPGIKVDMGLKDLPNFDGEKYTSGLDGLRERLKEYYDMGARFAKWRALLTISNPRASKAAIHVNATQMAMYAALCQEAGIVPIVEPEILLDGEHSIEESYEVTHEVLSVLFDVLKGLNVQMDGLILKSSMVLSGKNAADRAGAEQVGEMTYKCLKETVPAEVPGIVFLSGGQSAEEATENLLAVNKAAKAAGDAPWQLTFSYARALQGPSLKIWAGSDDNIPAAREKFLERLQANSKARMGEE